MAESAQRALPPPATALVVVPRTLTSSRDTVLWLKLLWMIVTDGASTVLMAPPHAEQAVKAFKQVAVLFSNSDLMILKELEMAPIAPPDCAVLL